MLIHILTDITFLSFTYIYRVVFNSHTLDSIAIFSYIYI